MKCPYCDQNFAEALEFCQDEPDLHHWQVCCDTVGCDAKGPVAFEKEKAVEVWMQQVEIWPKAQKIEAAARGLMAAYPAGDDHRPESEREKVQHAAWNELYKALGIQ